MSDAGWFPDPSGRFGRRWFDGAAWTDDVVAADGRAITDTLPATERPYPPPAQDGRQPAAAPPAPTPPGATPYGPPYGPPQVPPPGVGPPNTGAWGTPYAPTRSTPAPGLAVAGLGLLLAALSLFALKWVDTDKGRFTDLSSAVRKAGSLHVPAGIFYYAGGIAFALFAATVLTVGLAAFGSEVAAPVLRVSGAVFAAVAAVMQTVTVAKIFTGSAGPQVGAWLGIVGYVLVTLAMALGVRRVARA